MKDLKENYLAKLIMVVAVIFTMLFSTVAPIISYAEEIVDGIKHITSDNDYVKFDVNWASGGKDLTMNNGTTTANFTIQFDTIDYFTDFRIVVEGASNVSASFNNTGEYFGAATSNQMQYLNKIPGGTRLSGTINFTFSRPKDYSDYTRNINVKLYGIYKDKDENGNECDCMVELTKVLNADIKSKADVYAHTASLNNLTSSNVINSISYASNTSELMSVNRITMTYPILAQATNAENTKLELDIYRTIGSGDNLEVIYPSSVTANNGLTSRGFKLTKVENEDGTVKYFLEKGAVHDEYSSSNIYDLSSPNGSLSVVYNLNCPERDDAVSTNTYINVKMESRGWTTTINGEGTTRVPSLIEAQNSYTQSFTTYRYTPGTINWGNTYKNTSGNINVEAVDKLAEGEKLNLVFRLTTSYNKPGYGENPSGTTTITENAPTIKWYNYTTKRFYTRTLSAGEVRVKKINVSGMVDDEGAYIKFYKPGSSEPFFTADKDHLVYEFEDGDDIANFTVKANDMVKNSYSGYNVTYEINGSKLIEKGVSSVDISNIREISQSHSTSGAHMYGNTLTATYTVQGYHKEPLSHLRIATKYLYVRNGNNTYYYNYNTDLTTAATDVGKSIETNIYLSLSTLGFSTGTSGDVTHYEVSTTNPKIYVVLPDEFDFIINSITASDMPDLSVTGYKIKIVNNKKVLEITTNGKFEMRNEHYYYYTLHGLRINCTRILKQGVTSNAGTLYAYMTSDEGKYYQSGSDPFDVNDNGNINDVMAHDSLSFSITKSSQIQLSTGAHSINGDLKTNEDVILPAGSTVNYTTILDNNYTTIKNINIVTRLPFEGNKSIKSADKIDLESETTLTNLRNIKVYTVNNYGTKKVVAASNYTIGYSEEEEAGLDSEFATSVEDINKVKTLQVKFAPNYLLSSGQKILVEYDMDIPEDTEKGDSSSQIVAARYTTSSGGKLDDQESSKIRVVVGEPTGKIEVIKTFSGSKPDADVKGIKIKIQNMYNEEQVYEAYTDEEGHVLFEDVPHGYWKITEETEFDDFECLQTKYAIITNGEKYLESLGNAVNLINTPKYGNITIYKTWKNSSTIVNGYIRFNVNGTTVGGDSYTKNSNTSTYKDDDGNTVQKTTIRVPYGEYTVSEEEAKISSNSSGTQWGWYADSAKVSVHQPEVEVHIENQISYGSLKIIKTVPQGETVKGLKFHLYGRGDASYTDENGEKVYLDVDETFTIGEDGTATVEHLPLGVYTLEEIDMPTITLLNGQTEKYIPIRKTVMVTKRDGVDEYNIDNKYKKGNIDVTVTATSGANLSLFKVQIQGTSYYGSKINQIYDVPETGKLSIKDIPLGTYKVTEYDTRTENGKIYTNDPDGFEVTYNPSNANTTGVEVEYKKTAKVNIHNAYNGVGYLQINKTLEGEDDPSAAEGIQFIVKGKNLIGEEYEETITIGSDGIGRSGAIPVGTYLLTEVEDTVSLKYGLVEDKEITIKKAHTENKPLVLNLENPIATNELKMDTELKNGGYPPLPVEYKVTEINDSLEPIGEPVNILGDKKSHAEILSLKAGRYLVEQASVPSGYVKDDPQVVTIDRKNPGYALFIIDKPDGPEFEKTKLTITKQVVNDKDETATDEDFTNAKLDSRNMYSFEFKITNTETKQEYYSFAEESKTDTIIGLPYGTYEIEEIYKPKFKFVEMTGEKLSHDEATNKYTFTFNENGSTLENSVYVNVKNKIDTEFGFGGQDHNDNLSKEIADEEERVFVTQAKIYVRDDENNRVSDATFKLLDSNGNTVKFTGANGIYVYDKDGEETLIPSSNGAIYVKALPVGTYTLVNETVGEAYLKSADKEIIVYDSVVGVNRVETLRNIPRGSLKLSTIYKDEDGVENYTPRSKYKILNPETWEVLTFVKKADGTYYRSNLPTATETIALKQGYVNIEGIEAGIPYQIGLVDVTEKYGIIDTEPETITIEEGVNQEVKTEVKDRRIKFIKVETQASGGQTVALDASGKIWAYDYNYNTPYTYNKNNYNIMCVNDLGDEMHEPIKDVRFVDIATTYNMISAIDTDGKLWTWGWGNSLQYSTIPTCVSDIEGCPLNNVKVKQVAFQQYDGRAMYILDENGKIWFKGSPLNYASGQEPWVYVKEGDTYCTSLSEKCDLADVTISYIANGNSNQMVAIDNNGKVWTWGQRYNGLCGLPYESGVSYNSSTYDLNENPYYIKPLCISNLEGSNIKNVKMKKAACGYYANYLIDTDGKLWAFGSTEYYSMGIPGEKQIIWNPICLSDPASTSTLAKIKFKDIANQYETVSAVDTDGKLWTWGYECDNGMLGTGKRYYDEYGTYISVAPICVSDLDNNELRNYELEQVSAPYYNRAAAVDSDGNLWMWGDDAIPRGAYGGDAMAPSIIHVANNAHFDIPTFTKMSASYGCTTAIDENGKVWVWGENINHKFGIGNPNSGAVTQIPTRIGGQNDAISGETIVDISSGYYHTLAIDKEGKLWAWGYNYNSSFGGYTYNSSQPVPICITNMEGKLQGKKIKKISAGYERSVVIDEDGNVYTMGYKDYGALGIGDTEYKSDEIYCLNEIIPEFKGTNKKFVDAKYGFYDYNAHLILLDEDGMVWTCGCNQYGELGYGAGYGNSSSSVSPPQDRPYCISRIGNALQDKKIVAIACGSYHTSAAIDEDGNLYMWGYNGNGELGIGTNNNSYEPICLTTDENNRLYGKKIEKVELGYNMALVVDSEGKVYTTGANYSFQLGQGYNDTGKHSNVFVCINNHINFVPEDISVGYYYGIGIDKNHDVWTWGYCQYFQNGADNQYSKPVKWFGPTNVYDSAVDTLDESGMIEIIRHTDRIGTSSSSSSAQTKVNEPKNLVKKMQASTNTYDSNGNYVSGYSYLALDKDGKLWSWGVNNSYGILGNGTTVPNYAPIELNTYMDNATISEIVAFNSSNVIVKDTNGNLWGWGLNSSRIIKDDQTASYKTPTNIMDGTVLEGKKLTQIIYGTNYMYALDEDGKVYAWGYCSNYLGNGQTSGTIPPTLIGPDTDMANAKIVRLQVTYGATYAYTEDGQVYAWGRNNANQCMNGNTTPVTYPNKLGKGTSFSGLKVENIYALDSSNTLLLTTGKKLYAWGQNYNGILGIGTTTAQINDPVCLSDEKNFTVREVVSTGSTNVVIDTTGKLWAWGSYNSYGQIGIGSYAAVPSATCISREKFKVKEVILKGSTMMIRDTNDKIWAWGYNYSGICGNGVGNSHVLEPYCVTPDFSVSEIITTSNPIIVKDSNGKLWAWGSNLSGACGVGNNESYITPTRVAGESTISKVYTASSYGMIFGDNDGNIWATGYYTAENIDERSNVPVCISDGTDLEGKTIERILYTDTRSIQVDSVYKIVATVFIKCTDGKIYSWGYNENGEAGVGSDEKFVDPTCIEDVDFVEINRYINNNERIYKATDSEGKEWSWGSNKNLDILGQPAGKVTSPVCLTDLYEEIGFNPDKVNVITLTTGNKAYIDEEGNVWTWGNLGYICGAGTNTPVITPTCISTEHNGLNLKEGTIHYYGGLVYAINSNGDAWVWGRNKTYPIRLKDTTALKDVKIMEIGFDTTNSKLAVLTDGGEIYNVDLINDVEIEQKEYSGEILETIGNITTRPFVVVTDAEYNK